MKVVKRMCIHTHTHYIYIYIYIYIPHPVQMASLEVIFSISQDEADNKNSGTGVFTKNKAQVSMLKNRKETLSNQIFTLNP